MTQSNQTLKDIMKQEHAAFGSHLSPETVRAIQSWHEAEVERFRNRIKNLANDTAGYTDERFRERVVEIISEASHRGGTK